MAAQFSERTSGLSAGLARKPEDMSGPNGTNLSKPLKCGYNPYTGEWAEWSTNPLKQKAIDFYGKRDMVSNEELKIKNEE